MIKVCGHELKRCPYCGSKGIHEGPRREALPHTHIIYCEKCGSFFFVPCED